MLGHVPPRIRLDGRTTAIRPLSTADVDEYAAAVAANREHTQPWEPVHAEAHYTRAGQAETLRRDAEAWDLGTGYAFSILDRGAGDRIIGRIALGNVVHGAWRNATLGYWVAAAAGGRGHATEAAQLICAFAFDHAGLHRVQPAVIPRNIRSIRVVEKAGFRREGRALHYLNIAGRWEDHDIFAMTLEDWLARSDRPVGR
ncbi:GNAT family N-acetyltransferase [Baekduia soli]|uniref:GNAT family N-acetyltransferase n=1 Tax=Baekduia soli TaxID=496014 RepID=UPI001651C625|nr:GNAT family protein [Baekduia soli]